MPTYPSAYPRRHPSSTVPDGPFERALFKNRFPLGRRLVTALPRPAQELFRETVYRLAAVAGRSAQRT